MEEEKLPVPSVNVNLAPQEQRNELIKSEQLVGYCDEALGDIRDDRQEVDQVLKNFLEMVINEGDASTSSKEAVVNLLKLKSDMVDKKIKIIDLYMRAYVKDSGFPKYMSSHVNQYNQINTSKSKLLKSIEDETK